MTQETASPCFLTISCRRNARYHARMPDLPEVKPIPVPPEEPKNKGGRPRTRPVDDYKRPVGRPRGRPALHPIPDNIPPEPEVVDDSYEPFRPLKKHRDMVEMAMACGYTIQDCCKCIISPTTGMPIKESTLMKHFAQEVRNGALRVNLKVASNLLALSAQNPAAAIYWTKAKLGWKEAEAPDPSRGIPSSDAVEVARRIAFIVDAVANRRALPSGVDSSRLSKIAGVLASHLTKQTHTTDINPSTETDALAPTYSDNLIR
jgi:hypothetical protein